MKITRKQLRKLISEVTNYASLAHQGMDTLRKIIHEVISEEDIKTAVGRLAGTQDYTTLTAIDVADWMMSYYNNYYDKIAFKIRMGHPSLEAVLIDDKHPSYQRRPQEIDRRRIAEEIAKIYGDDVINYYIDYFTGPGLYASKE